MKTTNGILSSMSLSFLLFGLSWGCGGADGSANWEEDPVDGDSIEFAPVEISPITMNPVSDEPESKDDEWFVVFPTVDWPSIEDPGSDDPGSDDPGSDDPGSDDPGSDDPGSDDPDSDDPGSDDPGTDDPDEDDPSTDDPVIDYPLPLPDGRDLELRGVVVSGATGRPVMDSFGNCVRTGHYVSTMHPRCEDYQTQFDASIQNRAVYFDVDSSELTEAAKSALEVLVDQSIQSNVFFGVNVIGPISDFQDRGQNPDSVSADRVFAVYEYARDLLGIQGHFAPWLTLQNRNNRLIAECDADAEPNDIWQCLYVRRNYSTDGFSAVEHIVERLLIEW